MPLTLGINQNSDMQTFKRQIWVPFNFNPDSRTGFLVGSLVLLCLRSARDRSGKGVVKTSNPQWCTPAVYFRRNLP